MERYRSLDMCPRLLPVVLEEQRVRGTFADAVHWLVDLLNLSAFDARYRNDATGARAHAPGVLLTAVLLAYSQGIVSSRRIEDHMLDHRPSYFSNNPSISIAGCKAPTPRNAIIWVVGV